MQTATMRTRVICALATVCLLTIILIAQSGSAHAAQISQSGSGKNLPSVVKPNADPNATITNISISFLTHDDNKDSDTVVSVLVQNKVGFLNQTLASLSNFAGTTQFGDDPQSVHTYNLNLASANVKLSDLTAAPTFVITIAPNGNDTWIFDATLTITTSDGSQFSSVTSNINLSQSNRVFNGVFH